MSDGSTAHPLIVVGYDGSPASHAAVERAVDRVEDGGRMLVVHAYQVPADFVGASYYQEMVDAGLQMANKVIEDLRSSEPRLAGVDWEADVVPGHAATAIVRAAETWGADEIILGTRGVGRVRALLGSVAHDVLHDATCPVTVIPERAAVKAVA